MAQNAPDSNPLPSTTATETLELESQTSVFVPPPIVTRFTIFHERHTIAIRITGAFLALTLFTLELWGRIDDIKD